MEYSVILFIMGNLAKINRHDYVVKLFDCIVNDDINPAFLNKVTMALLQIVSLSYL